MSNKPISKEPPKSGEYREHVTMSDLIFRQVDRINQTAMSDPSQFDSAVDGLFQLCPSEVRGEVVSHVDAYKQKRETPQFKYNAGVPMGTVEHPVKLPDGSIWSPIVIQEEFVDYRSLFSEIMKALQSAHITWKTDALSVEDGRVDAEAPKIPPQTAERCRMFLEKCVEDDAATGSTYTYFDLASRIVPDVPPPTPQIGEGAEEDEAVAEEVAQD